LPVAVTNYLIFCDLQETDPIALYTVFIDNNIHTKFITQNLKTTANFMHFHTYRYSACGRLKLWRVILHTLWHLQSLHKSS